MTFYLTSIALLVHYDLKRE